MAHNRIITSFYSDDFKTARVVKSSQYGEFCETAHCSPDDEPNAWDGQKIAERRCDIQIQKAKAKDYQSRLKGMKHLQQEPNAHDPHHQYLHIQELDKYIL